MFYLSQCSSLHLATGGLHIFPYDYTARHFTRHTSHTPSVQDPFEQHRIKTDVFMQNIDCCQHVLEADHYYRVLTPQHCNFMLVKFMCFRILKC